MKRHAKGRSGRMLHLASRSPRRREILAALGLEFSAASVNVDETVAPGEAADRLVLRLAEAKARAATADDVVLGADTVVVLDDEIFGKPAGRDAALDMLSRLSGRTHRVLTGVAVLHDGVVDTRLSATAVRFRDIHPDEARRYWQSGEPRDKAGAYGIQGRGGIFVAAIDGSYSGVVGLPVFETAELLGHAGIQVL